MEIEQIIKERYKELPEDIQQAIRSTDLASKFETIAQKHGLHIDQNGALQTETILVMLGLETTDNFVDRVQKELEVSRNEAQSIAVDVNKEVFDSIRASLRKLSENEEHVEPEPMAPQKSVIPAEKKIDHETTFSTIEQVGQFTLDRTPASASPQYKETSISKEKTLEHIEDKPDHPPITLTDHLLNNPVINVEKQIVETQIPAEVKAPEQVVVPETKTPTPEVKKYAVDPYRETF